MHRCDTPCLHLRSHLAAQKDAHRVILLRRPGGPREVAPGGRSAAGELRESLVDYPGRLLFMTGALLTTLSLVVCVALLLSAAADGGHLGWERTYCLVFELAATGAVWWLLGVGIWWHTPSDFAAAAAVAAALCATPVLLLAYRPAALAVLSGSGGSEASARA